jgi:hypothetical protein
MSVTHDPQFELYKPQKKQEQGAALQLKFSKKANCVFLEIAPQLGEKLAPGVSCKQFDWEKKIVMKLGWVDVGQLLAVLNGVKPDANLIHKLERDGTPTRMTGLKFVKQTGQYTNYMLGVNQKVGDVSSKNMIYVDHHEAEGMKLFLTASLTRMFGF